MIDYSPLWVTMEKRNISQYYLVNNGIDYRTMQQLRNNQNITASTIEKLCRILSCTPNDILTFTDDVKKVPLIDVVKIKRGVRVVKSQLAVEGEYPVFQNSMTPLGYMDKANCTGDTAFIITAGAAGEIGYTDNDFWAADDCFSFECPQYLKSKYLTGATGAAEVCNRT